MEAPASIRSIPRSLMEEQRIRVEYIPTGDQVADVLTKALPREKHEKFSAGLGLA